MTTTVLTNFRIENLIKEEISKYILEQKGIISDPEEALEVVKKASETEGFNSDKIYLEREDGKLVMAMENPDNCELGPDGFVYCSGPPIKVSMSDQMKDQPEYKQIASYIMTLGRDDIVKKIGDDYKFTDSDGALKPIQAVGDKAVEIRDKGFFWYLVGQLTVWLTKKFANKLTPQLAKQAGKVIAKVFSGLTRAALVAGIGKTAGFLTAAKLGLTAMGLGPGLVGAIIAILGPFVLDKAMEYFVVEKDIFGVRGGISRGNPANLKRNKKMASIRASGKKMWPKGDERLVGNPDLWPIPIYYNYCKMNGGKPPTGFAKTGNNLAKSEGGSGQSYTFISCAQAKALYSAASLDPKIMQKEFDQAVSQTGRRDAVEAFNKIYYPNAIFDYGGFVKFKENVSRPQAMQGLEADSDGNRMRGTGTYSIISKATKADRAEQLSAAKSLGMSVKTIQEILISLYGKNILPKYGDDNNYGTETKSAIARFQKDNGLEITGIFKKPELDVVLRGIEQAEAEQEVS